jgi:hypothetical protein
MDWLGRLERLPMNPEGEQNTESQIYDFNNGPNSPFQSSDFEDSRF